MTEIHRTEAPAVTRNHTVWLRPEPGEDWGTLHADHPAGGTCPTFRPNVLCVIVAETPDGQFRATWSQAREEREVAVPGDAPRVECHGTQSMGDPEWLPTWWLEAEGLAIRTIRQTARDAAARDAAAAPVVDAETTGGPELDPLAELRRLQADSHNGFHRLLESWVDDSSSVARVLRAYDYAVKHPATRTADA